MKNLFWPEMKGYRDIKFGLDRVYKLLKRLDNPHLKLPPAIHVAGTNGKGSTLAFLQAILQENNYKVHKYTSPHLVNFNERIIINGEEIEDDFFNQCLSICKERSEISPKVELTFFEGITVAAFLAFSLKKADILLLETGMGGELDATNVLPKVLCSIITSISKDHQNFLGNKIAEIASSKAGIIKNNCPIVTIEQSKITLNVIKDKAKQLNAPLSIIGKNNFKKDNFFIRKKNSWELKARDRIYELPLPNLIGEFQIENAALAILALLKQDRLFIDENSFKKAIIKAKWSGRIEKITKGIFYNKLPNNFELYIDGGHNIGAAQILNDFFLKQKNKKIIVIMTMLSDKDCNNFIKKIAKNIDLLIATTIENEKHILSPNDICKIAKKQGVFNIKEAINLEAAFKIIDQQNKIKDSLIMICGSLYLVGNFLDKN